MTFEETTAAKIPIELLLQADPSVENITSYIENGLVFAAMERDLVVGVIVAGFLSDKKMEIYNVSVLEEFQKRGVGSKLMEFVLIRLKSKGVARIEVGTGAFGYPLTYYQRIGFRVDAILKDHFVNNYPETIYENGIQHKDMLRLYLNLE
ncbi:GNAT family N-acetyltransferase [Marinomonas sp. TW1]|uniref:GNAT family N-acetyltransferase n=1 Tax=Marinomonas sp. TW1 TaxID=1561203 RepID=UPI0007AF906B|nr:GNAT family N-acetyltransferase [Marinomonas sp. TW1]KZN14891.1 GCN5 family acetyltransferase [Marinomonas sp. TW1]